MSLFLGIDTSNYTTSVALYDSATGLIAQQKKLLPVREGQLGLRQSDAVFHHTAQLHTLFAELMSDVDPREIAAIGASTRPRPIDGSYMPCFTVGENTAKILSSALRVPLFEYSHQEGHIAAALYSSKRDDLFDREFLAFHVSGGTTEAVIAKGDGFGFSVEPAAKTLDLNAGQAVDRVGLMLGLRFPCGMELERLAAQNAGKIKVRPTLKGCDCCLSGVENRCQKLIKEGRNREYVAAFCIEYIRVTLAAMTDAVFETHGVMPVVYAGGVMSNKMIKNSFEEKYNAVFAEPVFSSDNAAGIAYLCFRKFNNVHT
ncbi:peptidase M22 [Ruminococcus sp.]|uniref:peptidase M22 n=1 Tax=Ruminococcus sp. TaxID=41978 RepID=UPI002E78D31F|nr:peptidase M22 [Ruminococcus sp.]MEE1263645.1 peptidase M22 [Ruminococcus sp.]